jgi:hypothetical protein
MLTPLHPFFPEEKRDTPLPSGGRTKGDYRSPAHTRPKEAPFPPAGWGQGRTFRAGCDLAGRNWLDVCRFPPGRLTSHPCPWRPTGLGGGTPSTPAKGQGRGKGSPHEHACHAEKTDPIYYPTVSTLTQPPPLLPLPVRGSSGWPSRGRVESRDETII